MLLGEHLYSHEHVDQICACLVKYFGIFNHIKMFRYEYQNSSITRLFILEYNTVEHTGTLFDSNSVWLQQQRYWISSVQL